MKDYKSSTGTRTETIGELALRIKSHDTASCLIDTAVARDFEVEITYAFIPGWEGTFGGPMEDAEPGEPDAVEIALILAESNVQFEGEGFSATAKRGTDLMELFTGAQIAAMEDKILKDIQEGGEHD